MKFVTNNFLIFMENNVFLIAKNIAQNFLGNAKDEAIKCIENDNHP